MPLSWDTLFSWLIQMTVQFCKYLFNITLIVVLLLVMISHYVNNYRWHVLIMTIETELLDWDYNRQFQRTVICRQEDCLSIDLFSLEAHFSVNINSNIQSAKNLWTSINSCSYTNKLLGYLLFMGCVILLKASQIKYFWHFKTAFLTTDGTS